MSTAFALFTAASLLLRLIGSSDAQSCSGGKCQLGGVCKTSDDCAGGLFCSSCAADGETANTCHRYQATDVIKIRGGLPFNRYSWLTTHNSFAIVGAPSQTGPRTTFYNQEDNVTEQLNNGVRGFMLDMYDFMDDIWLCHSFGGVCYNFTAFEPAVNTLKEMSTFLAANPSEVITIFIEDYVSSQNGLTNLFKAAGLDNYLFPVSSMPKDGGDWMTLTEMISKNYRLLVFTSKSAKEASEGIAYDWRYVNENQYGDAGTQPGNCSNRAESEALNTTSRSLLLMNFFPTNPVQDQACTFNSASLLDMLPVCYKAAGNRWPNFLAVDYCKRSDGGGVFSALDGINGGLICGCPDITSCKSNSSFGVCSNATTPPTTTTGNFSGNLNSIPPSAPVDERSTGFRMPSFHFQFILFQASIILVFHWTFT